MNAWRRSTIAVVAMGAIACSPVPSHSIAPTTSAQLVTHPTGAARFTVTGEGGRCGPWWFGCGAFLAVEAPGWKLPAGWNPTATETSFRTEFIGNSDDLRFTGVGQAGQDHIEPGDYQLVVIMATEPDSPPEATMSASIGCSVELEVASGTRTVGVDVDFDRSPCLITVSIDA